MVTNDNNVINLSVALKGLSRLPDDTEGKTALIQEYYGAYLKLKHVQLYEERKIVTRSILDERPNFPQGLTKDQQKLLILKHTIANELSRRPHQDMVALAIFVDSWWKLKQKLATQICDRRFPDCTPEERLATIHSLCMESDPN
jgi:hypothetical protein